MFDYRNFTSRAFSIKTGNFTFNIALEIVLKIALNIVK
jgi:hypothetical protein